MKYQKVRLVGVNIIELFIRVALFNILFMERHNYFINVNAWTIKIKNDNVSSHFSFLKLFVCMTEVSYIHNGHIALSF